MRQKTNNKNSKSNEYSGRSGSRNSKNLRGSKTNSKFESKGFKSAGKKSEKPFFKNSFKSKTAKKKKPTENKTPIDNNAFPMRINKFLAHQGLSTRKQADTLIEKGRVFINDKKAELGDKVFETDKVSLAENSLFKKYQYFVYNKPKGIITHSAQRDEKDIKSMLFKFRKDIFPIGRLDKDSHGLIILTNDGRITDKLLNPEFEHEKEYVVKTARNLRQNFKEKMEGGIMIEGYKTKPCKIKILGPNLFQITLTEGKKHQIKRMVVANFNEVVDLKRIRVMNIKLGNLAPNQIKEIKDEELDIFLQSLNLPF
jgi:23S rRNA pseudouridine2604 synthase